jgi:hypothetical protein
MSYSRPWMYLGLTFMAAGAILLCQQGCQPKPAMEATSSTEPVQTESSDSASAKSEDQAEAKSLEATKSGESAASTGESEKSPADEAKSPQTATEKPDSASAPSADASPWTSLFDGQTLSGWKVQDLGGGGKVSVKDGAMVLDSSGAPMVAVSWEGEVLHDNYELTLEGMRIEGSDFFCTTTFPVGDDPCTLVVGGWGGQVVGLSNVDYSDASENATTKIVPFNDKQWYRVRLRVSDAAIQAWIDDKPVVNQRRKGHKFNIRIEVNSCRPLGIATWYTTGAVRNIRIRPLTADEIQAVAAAQPASSDDN